MYACPKVIDKVSNNILLNHSDYASICKPLYNRRLNCTFTHLSSNKLFLPVPNNGSKNSKYQMVGGYSVDIFG